MIPERKSQRYLQQLAQEQEMISGHGPGHPAQLSAMLPRFENQAKASIDIGRGWWPLVVRADRNLRQFDDGYVLRHVKEELSELWFDALPSDQCSAPSEFRDIVIRTEREAARTCEVCGARGRMMRQGDWFVTLCWDDAEERGAHLMGSDENLDSVVPRTGCRERTLSSMTGSTTAARQPAGRRVQRERIEALRRRIDADIAAWPSTAEFAWQVGLAPHRVERLRRRGYVSAERLRDGLWRFAPWQIGHEDQLLPHLSDVIEGAPLGVAAYDLHAVMTNSDSSLAGQSPSEWLLAGGAVSAVLPILNKRGTPSEVNW